MPMKLLSQITALLLGLLVMSAAPGKRTVRDAGADERKSDYIFMEGLRQHQAGHDDAYYELLRRAFELNPNDDELAFYVGYYDLMTSSEDSARFARGHSLMKRHFDNDPGDYYNNFVYAQINDRIGNGAEALRVWTILDSIYPEKSDIAFRYAEALVRSRDSLNVAKSIGVFERVEKAQGKSIPVSTRKISAYFTTQDTMSILREVRDLLASSPRSPENNVFAGDIYAMFSERDSALHYYDRACELDPGSGLAYYSRANFYKSAGDSIAYDREIFQALKQSSLDLDTKMELLTSYIRELYEQPAQQPRIRELFATLLDQHPHEAAIHDLYCSYLMALEDYGEAAEQMSYALDIDPVSEDRWHALITLYLRADEIDKASEASKNALHYYPDNSMLHFIAGTTATVAQQYDKALAELERAAELTDSADIEQLSSIQSSIGDVYYAMGDRDKAFTYYDLAINTFPDNLLALNNCAYYLAVEGRDLERAERMSAITVKAQPENATSLDTYAWVLFKMKQYVEAKAYIDKAIANSPELGDELLEHAGDIYFMNGEPKQAVEYWEEALKLAPDNELLKRKVKNRAYYFE